MTLLLTRVVLNRDVEHDSQLNHSYGDRDDQPLLAYTLRDEETDEIKRVLSLDRLTVEDMGNPDQITVSVEPGVHLEDVR